MVLTASPWSIWYLELKVTLAGAGTVVTGTTLIGRSSMRVPVSMASYFDGSCCRPLMVHCDP
ncbi:hypothetical protein JTM46_36110, partial [Pseudomonas aeruginosa]|nr:hypothetical protein [Pseudomonas aeruginosa]